MKWPLTVNQPHEIFETLHFNHQSLSLIAVTLKISVLCHFYLPVVLTFLAKESYFCGTVNVFQPTLN